MTAVLIPTQPSGTSIQFHWDASTHRASGSHVSLFDYRTNTAHRHYSSNAWSAYYRAS